MQLVKIFDTEKEAEEFAAYLKQQPETGLYRLKRDIDSWLRNQRSKTELMIKSQVSNISNWGMLLAWEQDPDKDKYSYFWNNPEDKRSKKISLIRKSGNPYSYSEIRFLWTHQQQMIDGKLEDDSYNQRCSISRELKHEAKQGKEVDNRFYNQAFNFRRTLPA